MIIFRHKLHLLHNRRGSEDEEKVAAEAEEIEKGGEEGEGERGKKKKEDYYDVEMAVDESKFGDVSEIVKGKFVSFYYSGELSGRGPPINPKVLLSFLSCFYTIN